MSNMAAAPSSLSAFTRWRIVVLLMGFAALGHFNRNCISVAGDERFTKTLGISEEGMGWVYTTLLIFYTICMLPGGWLIDRIGSARALTLFGVTMGTFAALTGTLGWITNSPESLWVGLLIIRGLTGMCNSTLHPGAAHVISDMMSDRRRATANGLVTAGALIGVATCFPAFGWLMDRMDWPLAFVVSGVALIAYGLLWQRFASPQLPGPPPVTPQTSHHMGWRAVWTLLNQRNIWLLTLSYAAFGYFQYLFFYWMGYYFKDVLHIPVVQSRASQFYIMMAQGAGMVLGGLCTDAICGRLGTIRGRRAIVMTGMGLSAVFGLLGVSVTGQWNVTICLAISMGSLGICEGVFWTTATDIGGRFRGFSGAFMNTGGNVGGLISPVLTPIMAKSIGWTGSIVAACIISGLGGLVWFAIKPSGGRLNYQAETPPADV